MKSHILFSKFLYINILVLLSCASFAATITVTDSGNSGANTLRQAVLDAVNGDTIVFDGSVTSITLSSNIEINKNITIDGPGADVLTISGGGTSGIFHVNTSGTAVIRDVLLTNGKAGEESLNLGGFDFSGGGAIFHQSGTLQVINCEFTNNNADGGSAFEYGGAIVIFDDMSITNSTFSGNSVTGSAVIGGAVYVFQSSTVALTNCTFINNSSLNEAGAVGITAFNGGTPSLTVTNCTFFNNSSSGNTAWGQDIDALNDGYTLILHNNIFDRSSADDHVSVRAIGTSTITSRGGNIFRDTPTFTTIASDDVNQGINSSGIASSLAANNTLNGVRTLSITGAGSLATDNGTTGFDETTTDARGATRNGTIDSGAYEFWTAQGVLPVELTSFTALLNGSVVELRWETASEVSNYGFEIEKLLPSPLNLGEDGFNEPPSSSGNWERIGFVNGHGNSNSPKSYEFIDEELLEGTSYYRLKQIDYDGSYEYSNVVEISLMKSLPKEYVLHQNYPNPFNPTTIISYVIPSGVEQSKVRLVIYDVLGNEITTLLNEAKPTGSYEIEFDGGNLPSGNYYYQLITGDYKETKKMLLIK